MKSKDDTFFALRESRHLFNDISVALKKVRSAEYLVSLFSVSCRDIDIGFINMARPYWMFSIIDD